MNEVSAVVLFETGEAKEVFISDVRQADGICWVGKVIFPRSEHEVRAFERKGPWFELTGRNVELITSD